MKRTPLTRTTPLKASPAVVQAFKDRARVNSKPSGRRAISPASAAQRKKVQAGECIVCHSPAKADPAHLIDRSLCPAGADDPRAVVPLCREHHRQLVSLAPVGDQVEMDSHCHTADKATSRTAAVEAAVYVNGALTYWSTGTFTARGFMTKIHRHIVDRPVWNGLITAFSGSFNF